MQATRNEGGGAKKKRSGVGWPYRNPRRYVTRECKSVFMNGAAVIPGGHEDVRGKRIGGAHGSGPGIGDNT